MPKRTKKPLSEIVNDEINRFVTAVAPAVASEAIKFATALASTLRKTLHVCVLGGFGYLTALAFDLPEEGLIKDWIAKASAIVIGFALLYDLVRAYLGR